MSEPSGAGRLSTPGEGFERLLAAALVVVAVYITWLQAHPRVPAGVALEDPFGGALEAPGVLAFMSALFLAGTGTAVFLVSRALARRREHQDEPAPDPTHAPPPWSLAQFLLVFGAGMVFAQVAQMLLPAPSLISEGGRVTESLRESREETVLKVGTREAAKLSYWPNHGFVVRPLEHVPSEPSLTVNGVPVASGTARVLERHDEIQVGEKAFVLETPSLLAKMTAGVLANILTIAFALIVVRAGGGNARDLGFTTEGALSEVGRAAVRYLAWTPVIFLAVIASSGLCRLLGVPFEGHPILRELQREPAVSTVAAVLFSAALLGPVSEELVYRGLLLRALRRPYASRAAAVAISSFVFASLHPGLASLVPIFVVGSLFGTLFVTSRRVSLVAPIAAHAIFNGVNILVELALVRGR